MTINKTIRKRDGRLKEYNRERIEKAIKGAFDEALGTVSEECFILNKSIILSIIENKVVNSAEKVIDIENIQDWTVSALKDVNLHRVAQVFEDYRRERARVRTATSSLYKSVLGLVEMTNEESISENSNKNSTLASTQRDLIAGEISKEIAKNVMLPSDIVEAMNKGQIKVHDLDYYLSPITNCELINLKDMLDNGTVINKKMIEKPKSLRTASTIATQISAQISSSTFGGQTMSLSHLAPYVRISRDKIIEKLIDKNLRMNLGLTMEQIIVIAEEELREEVKDSVQTFNYQISTLNSTNGQSPFLSLVLWVSEDKEYEKENAILIEEFLRQRIKGLKNEFGVVTPQTFPKLLYFLDENNIEKDSEFYYLTKLAVESTSKTMNPDYISVKKMKEEIGHAYGCMGCRSFLNLWQDENGEYKFYGRGNMGVTTISVPYVALESKGNIEDFWRILDDRLELCKKSLLHRYDKLKNVKASVAPIMWQHGAIARLQPEDTLDKVLKDGRFSISLGYSGLYETVKYLTGEGQTEPKGFALAEEIMAHLKSKTEEWKKEYGLGFGLYGTPQESTGGWFNDKLVKEFGIIKDITDKGFITNSYHVDVRQNINAFDKLSVEAQLQRYSLGGNVSYVEIPNLSKNQEAVYQLVKYIYDTNIYAELNFEVDSCGKCKFSGVLDTDEELNWVCPQCGNKDEDSLVALRRTCGYLSETKWTKGRKKDILSRVKHL